MRSGPHYLHDNKMLHPKANQMGSLSNAVCNNAINNMININNNNNNNNNHNHTHHHNHNHAHNHVSGSKSNCKNSMQAATSALDALPKQFVLSMKKLFDILDDQHCGFVKLSDIEKGWQDDGSKGLPQGVLESLRKVTPPTGLLSFERFCAGLKLCLLRNQEAISKPPANPPRPPSAPLLEFKQPLTPVMPTAAIRPRPHAQRAISMPQLSPDSELEADFTHGAGVNVNVYVSPPPPPKPPRAAAAPGASAPNAHMLLANTAGNNLDKAEIRHALQNWHMNILLSELDAKDKQKLQTQFDYRGSADGGSSSATDSAASGMAAALQACKKSTSKRREPRRHTLQNGIDYNMLKRLKQYEEERELLLLGLDGVEKARDWYMQQVLNVQEKIKYFGRMDTNFEQYSEVQQERLNYQRARVLEINRSLTHLVHSWECGGYPQHINLAIRTLSKPPPHKRFSTATNANLALVGESGGGGGRSALSSLVVSEHTPGNDRLRQQNRQLTSELNIKAHRVSLLEREKQTLLSELYELQQRFGIAHNHHARNMPAGFVLSQPSPVSQSSGGLGDADVVY